MWHRFRAKHLPEIQNLKVSDLVGTVRQYGKLVESTIGQVESAQFC